MTDWLALALFAAVVLGTLVAVLGPRAWRWVRWRRLMRRWRRTIEAQRVMIGEMLIPAFVSFMQSAREMLKAQDEFEQVWRRAGKKMLTRGQWMAAQEQKELERFLENEKTHD